MVNYREMMFICFKGLNKDVTSIGRYDIGNENKNSCVWSDEKNRSSSSGLLDGHAFFCCPLHNSSKDAELEL
jgi:hypothetical protein